MDKAEYEAILIALVTMASVAFVLSPVMFVLGVLLIVPNAVAAGTGRFIARALIGIGELDAPAISTDLPQFHS